MSGKGTDRTQHVAVLGAGGWGTALSLVLAGKKIPVRLWVYFPEELEEIRRRRENVIYLPGFPLPKSIHLVGDPMEAVEGCRLVISAMPTQHVRPSLEPLADRFPARLPILSVSKGIEMKTHRRPSEVIREVLGRRRPLAILTGPSHAEEVARGLPTTVVAASSSPPLARRTAELFRTPAFRVYTHRDVRGAELGGALKNVMALAAGVAEGIGLGDNARAALVTRGVVEMARLGASLGARRETFFGLAGLGDLVTTCYSPFGRNRAVGVRIGKGESLSRILGSMKMVAEGVWTTRAVREIARGRGVEMPVTEEVYKILFRGKDPRRAVRDLMMRPPRTEM